MDREKRLLDADQLAHALAKAQKEVTGLDDAALADDENELQPASCEITGFESLHSNNVIDLSNVDLNRKLDSAKRVMELLARLKPQTRYESSETIVECDTPNDQNGLVPESLIPLESDFNIGKLTKKDIPGTIGKFEIISLLGQGGFGLVFKARDPELDRMVALKVPTFDSLIKADSQARFKQEGRVVASLSHPNIVPVYEVGSDGPISFIASELVEGTDLSKWILENGPCDPVQSTKTVVSIADAIQHAHSRHVVHRDLKPANVMLEFESDSGSFDPGLVRVTDFGLAKIISDTDTALTRTGSLMGTPAFSAPEQLRSESDEVGSANSADIYSIGAILYFLLTGRPPLESDGMLDLVRKVQSQDPIAPHKLRDEVPPDLSAICMKALEKTPDDRYASAHEMRVDLQRFLDGEPVVARPVRLVQRAIKWSRRNPAIAMLLVITMAAILLGSVASLWSARNARIAARQSRQQYLDSKKVVDEYYVKISRNPLFLSSSFRQQKLELLESAKKHFVSFLAENQDDKDLLVDLIRTHVYIATADSEGENLNQARQGFADSLEMIESASENKMTEQESLTELERLQALCLTGISEADRKLGNHEHLLANLNKATAIYEKEWPNRSTDQDYALDMLRAYQAFVHFHRGQNKPEEANNYSVKQQVLLEMIAAHQKLNATLQNLYSISLGDQSIYQRVIGNFDRSLEMLNQSIEISQELIDSEPNPVWFVEIAAVSYYRRGVVYARSGKLDLAIPDAKVCLKYFESISLYNRNPEVIDRMISARNLLAVCLNNTNQRAKAFELFEKNLIDSRKLVSDYPARVEFRTMFVGQILGLASAFIDDWQLEKAEELAKELEEILIGLKQQGISDPIISHLEIANCSEQGRLFSRKQQFEESVDRFDEAMELVTQFLRENPKNPAALDNKRSIHDNRSYSLLQLGRFDDAIADRLESRKLDRLRPEYQRIALAEAYALSGRIEQAREEISVVDSAAAKKELAAENFEMRMAFGRGAIAVELDKQLTLDPENVELQIAFTDELKLAEEYFLRAVELGYFDSDSKRFLGIVLRPHLQPLFELPTIQPIIEKQSLAWENR